MEESNDQTSNTPNQSPVNRVMDIQNPETTSSIDREPTRMNSDTAINNSPTDDPPSATPSTSPENSDKSSSNEGTESAQINDNNHPANSESHSNAPKPKHHIPIVVVITAILIVIALIVLVVFAYMKSKDDNITKTNATITESTNVSAGDVDSVTTDVDKALSGADDTADFSANDISDEKLSL